MIATRPLLPRLVASPACLPNWRLNDLLSEFAPLGFAKIELFTEWSDSRVDWRSDPAPIRALAAEHGITISSMHLPTVREPIDSGVSNALAAARFAAGLGASAVLFKAGSRELYATAGKLFLDGLEAEGIPVTPVLQNHAGTIISTLDDFRAVLAPFAGDPRMRALLEVGHFQRVGTHWREGWDLLADRVALIHVNEVRGGKSVPFGTGEVDFAGLMRHLACSPYAGDIVVELELHNQLTEPAETLTGLRDALALLQHHYLTDE